MRAGVLEQDVAEKTSAAAKRAQSRTLSLLAGLALEAMEGDFSGLLVRNEAAQRVTMEGVRIIIEVVSVSSGNQWFSPLCWQRFPAGRLHATRWKNGDVSARHGSKSVVDAQRLNPMLNA
jgi:hypothetical protein